MKITRRSFLSASALALLSCPLAPTASAAKSDSLLAGLFHSEDTALPLKPLTAKGVDANPFMGSSESNIHHDCYNTDSTDAVLPVGICPEVNVAMEKTNPNASPAIFFDNFDNPISPFLGGLAIRDLDAEEVRIIGFFSPAKHDGGGYLIQSSYSFVDGRNLIVCPTSHNHVLMLRATDESGTPLPVFQKVLDINIKEAAERVLGRSLEQNLLSIVFDYDGNLWFVTGGFRIYPSRGQQGAMGYISRAAIDTILAGGTADLSREVHVYAPAPGEGAENGIASCREGAVILTNLACYLLRANGGVEVVWRTPYDSVGAKDSREGAATTGGGLAWGGGCSPSLSRELVFLPTTSRSSASWPWTSAPARSWPAIPSSTSCPTICRSPSKTRPSSTTTATAESAPSSATGSAQAAPTSQSPTAIPPSRATRTFMTGTGCSRATA